MGGKARYILSIILLVSLILSMFGCVNPKKEVEDLILTFEASCNSLDFESVIDCVDPKIADKIELATGLIGLFTNTDKDELFESLAGWILNDYEVGAEFFASIDIDVKRITVFGSNADVDAILKFNMAGYNIENEATFKCIRSFGKWYISKLTIH